MIAISEEKGIIQLQFGNGDIGVFDGDMTDIEGNFYGFVGFKNVDICEIESPGNDSTFKEIPIQMLFSKAESIDIVINALNSVKDVLLKGQGYKEMK